MFFYFLILSEQGIIHFNYKFIMLPFFLHIFVLLSLFYNLFKLLWLDFGGFLSDFLNFFFNFLDSSAHEAVPLRDQHYHNTSITQNERSKINNNICVMMNIIFKCNSPYVIQSSSMKGNISHMCICMDGCDNLKRILRCSSPYIIQSS